MGDLLQRIAKAVMFAEMCGQESDAVILLRECARELERLEKALQASFDANAAGDVQLTAAEARLRVAREALDWYADIDNYSKRTGAPYDHGLDQGRRARQALAALSPDGGDGKLKP